MQFGFGAYGLGLLAGLLSTLSPCVLPLIPILLGSAANAHPRAPLALAGGLAISYAVLGSLLAWAGSALDIDAGLFRNGAALLLALLGLVLLSDSLQRRFATAAAGLGDTGSSLLTRIQPDGLRGQFAIGLVLGVVWSPCVGPTLGAAVVLASQGAQLPQVALLMGLFGLGAALPVVALAYVSRAAVTRMRSTLMQAGKNGKIGLGIVMVVIAGLILSGTDKTAEAWLLDHSPAWLTTLTTRF
ncbi:cytochrome c biogenesis CcdA family protein [Azoarcus sp. DN11]|uniref:cytochrome c biogenesis CcdA family protein n=1 Tax=Azoarcus sp. DN11 TaxID=356837 RepID=UPI000EB063CB|nr:cytochrome c biogenesis CcdA family protein [Azoarcus sp. DN11]AYH45685.1 cytochrome C biogenesis protein [Azoarcus sp. DN11]